MLISQKCYWPLLRQVARAPQLRLRSTGYRFLASAAYINPEIFDVVILGGGPAGLGLASALRTSRATSRLRVGLIEAQDLTQTTQMSPATSRDSWSNRCSSLTPASVEFLKEIGVWQHVDTSRVQPYTRMKVWDGVSGSRLTFDWAASQGLSLMPQSSPDHATSTDDTSTIAYMTENSNLTSSLMSRLKGLGGTEFFSPAKVDSIDLGPDTSSFDLRSWPIIKLSTGQNIAARLLVGADGPNSIVRTFAGIPAHGWDYDRMGVVATLRLESSSSTLSSSSKPDISSPDIALKQQPTAYQRFLPTGPAALLPMPGSYASLVWSTTKPHAAHLKSLSPPDLVAMINAAFRLSPTDLQYMHTIPSGQADELSWRLRHTRVDETLVPRSVASVQPGSVAAFPLKMRHADTYTGERVALVGDAAHSVHPLAGQGLNLGIGDVASLARVIGDAVDSGADIGGLLALEGYGRERYASNHVMLGAVDKLHKVFSWGAGPVVLGRSLGFDLLERWGWAKGRIMGFARG